MKYCLFDFFEEGTVDIGPTEWIDVGYLECHSDSEGSAGDFKYNNEDWDFGREVLVNWTSKRGKSQVTDKFVARVVYFSDDRRDSRLLEKREELLADSETEACTSKAGTSGKRALRKPLRFVQQGTESDDQEKRSNSSNSKKVKIAHQARDKVLLDRLAKKKEQEPKTENSKLVNLTTENNELRAQLKKVSQERDGLVAAIACLKEVPELLKKMTAVRPNPESPMSPTPSCKSPTGTLNNTEPSPKYKAAASNMKQAALYISDSMTRAFSREEMATHSLTGTASNANSGKDAKPALNPELMKELFDKTSSRYPDVPIKSLKEAAKNKISNERRLFKKSQNKEK